MCGILFVHSATPLDPTAFDVARDLMSHRGPDAAGSVFLQQGRVALGHRRLAILDLSPAANQPMQSGPCWIVYNGEIYNSPQLRDELSKRGHSFRTHSDTEVILEGFRAWGERICSRLIGMFAFVIWNEETREAFLARDPVGQKPLYYAFDRDRFVAASELIPLLRLRTERPNIRKAAVPEFLYYNYVPEPYTFYERVQALLPGHFAQIRFGQQGCPMRTYRYWDFEPDPEPPRLTVEQALEALGSAIEESVRAHLLADVEIGAFLSGGIDSSAVIAVASRCLPTRIKTFTLGMGEGWVNEAPRARETAVFLGTEHYEEYVPLEQFRASAEHVLDLFGQPFGDFSLVPAEQIAKLARGKVKCALSGDGGDEIFGGYAHYPRYVRFPKIEWRSWEQVKVALRARWHGLAQWRQTPNWGHVLISPAQAMSSLAPDFAQELSDYDLTWLFRKHWRPDLDPFRRAQWVDLHSYLPNDILVKVDRCTMRHSLEVRPPFLSRCLIETMMNFPPEIKNPAGELKWLFRQWCKGRIPDAVLTARKRGFGVPPDLFPYAHLDADPLGRFSHCIAEGLLTPDRARDVSRLRYASWKFEQIEQVWIRIKSWN